jgi:hypothetical protein
MAVGCSVALYSLALLPRSLVPTLTVTAAYRWPPPTRVVNAQYVAAQPTSTSSNDSNQVASTWRQHDLVREVDSRVDHRWQYDLLWTSTQLLTLVMVTISICIIVRGHARSHGTRRKGVVVLAYSEDDIRGHGGGLV